MLLLWASFLVLVSKRAHAAELGIADVPAPLRPWIEWVSQQESDALCAAVQNKQDERRCVWPSRLSLRLFDKGGQFEQEWRADRASWVVLPGDAKHWPLDTMVDGKPALVLTREGKPQIRIEAGTARIKGRFAWDSLPASVAVPTDTALLTLRVEGTVVDQFERTPDGSVFLQRAAMANEEESLSIAVTRHVVDDSPLLLETLLTLNVSGRAREVVLGKALSQAFIPMSLEGDLPVRADQDRRLRVQLRPGTFKIKLIARHEGPVTDLVRPDPEGPWADADEAWVFEARPGLRVVVVEGPAAVDPQQTTLPDEWKRLPAYTMPVGAIMRLVEKQRGDAASGADELTLARTYWLDFSGNGYTVRDTITGTRTRPGRLEMGPETLLGRVSDHGRDQLITRLSGATMAGIELRDRRVSLTADSRIAGPRSVLPAVSWNEDFRSVSSRVELPPGWRLLHVTGVDDVYPSWLKQWTLLDLFLVLISALAIGKLFGWGAFGLALVALVLIFPEPAAPKYVWLFVIFGEALARVLNTGVPMRLLRLYRGGVWVVLFAVAVPFAIQQVRVGLYPAQAQSHGQMRANHADNWGSSFGQRAGKGETNAVPEPQPIAQQAEEAAGSLMKAEPAAAPARNTAKEELDSIKSAPTSKVPAPGKGYKLGGTAVRRQASTEYDPNAMVQTGPGLPNWSWRDTQLRFNGPVERGQHIRLWLMPPWLTLTMCIAEVALLGALVLTLLFRGWRIDRLRFRPPATLVALLFALLAPGSARADDFPSTELLDQLKKRLSPNRECVPECGSIDKLVLEANESTLRIKIEATAFSYTAIPLPASAQDWLPASAYLDGKPAESLARSDGSFWVGLSSGRHEIVLEGPVPRRDHVAIDMPLLPHHVSYRVAGWRVDGVHEDGIADATLQLTRLRDPSGHGAPGVADAGAPRSGVVAEQPAEMAEVPSFVSVERRLLLGLKWEVETRVKRLTPSTSAVMLEIPLLSGEQVTSADVRAVHGHALINMAPQSKELSWRSTLGETTTLRLEAPRTLAWSERWRLSASPIYNVQFEGLDPVHGDATSASDELEWRPWPGESITLRIMRPEGAPGQTLTIDRTQLSLQPGLRSTEATLQIGLRASRGGEHTVLLPAGARLSAITIDGHSHPLRQNGRGVEVPIAPGPQTVELKWREPIGLGLVYRSPVLDLGVDSVNAEITVSMPEDRWLLSLAGPRMGPSVLFWSSLAVLLVVAIGLGRSNYVPLRTRSWLLLALGLSQVPVEAAMVVAFWFLALTWRHKNANRLTNRVYDLAQVGFVIWTLAACGVLLVAVEQGLLAAPDMRVSGNGSVHSTLVWFQDRAGHLLPRIGIISVPLLVYRFAMLAWALWLSFAVLKWAHWAWESFSEHGLWRPFRANKTVLATPESGSISQSDTPALAPADECNKAPPGAAQGGAKA